MKSKATADFLGISQSKLYKLTMNREIPHEKVFGQLRFDEEKLLAWLESKSINISTKDELEKKAHELGGENG